MGRHTLTSRTGRVFTGVLALLILLALRASTDLVRDVSLAVALVSGSALVLWRPRATVSDQGIEIINPLRRYTIAWQSIQRIDTRWSLQLYLENEVIAVHAGVSPGRHSSFFASADRGTHLPESTYDRGTIRPGDLIGTESGDLAAITRRFWEAHRGDPGDPVVQKAWDRIGVSLGLVCAATALAAAVLTF